MKWTCPECGTDIELEEDGSVKIYPLRYYSNSLSSKAYYCKLCGSEVGSADKYLPTPNEVVTYPYKRAPYPNIPNLTNVCVYAGPEYTPSVTWRSKSFTLNAEDELQEQITQSKWQVEEI